MAVTLANFDPQVVADYDFAADDLLRGSREAEGRASGRIRCAQVGLRGAA